MKFPPFGPHADKEINLIPTSYLEWCLRNLILSDNLHTEIEKELNERRKNNGPSMDKR